MLGAVGRIGRSVLSPSDTHCATGDTCASAKYCPPGDVLTNGTYTKPNGVSSGSGHVMDHNYPQSNNNHDYSNPVNGSIKYDDNAKIVYMWKGHIYNGKGHERMQWVPMAHLSAQRYGYPNGVEQKYTKPYTR
jgi:hypothetical protein